MFDDGHVDGTGEVRGPRSAFETHPTPACTWTTRRLRSETQRSTQTYALPRPPEFCVTLASTVEGMIAHMFECQG